MPDIMQITETQTAIDNAVALLKMARETAAARLDPDPGAADDLRALRGLAFDVAMAVDLILYRIAKAGNVDRPRSYSTVVYDAIHEDLAVELSVAATEAEGVMGEGYQRSDFDEHNTPNKAHQGLRGAAK